MRDENFKYEFDIGIIKSYDETNVSIIVNTNISNLHLLYALPLIILKSYWKKGWSTHKYVRRDLPYDLYYRIQEENLVTKEVLDFVDIKNLDKMKFPHLSNKPKNPIKPLIKKLSF